MKATAWLWWSHSAPARVVRGALLPAAALYSAVMAVRTTAYGRGWLATRRLPLPAVAVGNLAVGGTGKTPLAAWMAAYYARLGVRPGVLLRGYGDDEPRVHQRLVPEAIVVADPDRAAAAQRAAAEGARVLVLDDAFQRLDVGRDLNVVVLAAEHERAAPWRLPAGPWREGWTALARADLAIVTRKHAMPDEAAALAARIEARGRGRPPGVPVAVAHLALDHLVGLRTERRHAGAELARRRVMAAAGVADPAGFAAQLRALGASVQLVAYQDHHAYSARDIERLVRAAGDADYVVVTEKDAVKLRERWPVGVREPLVAALAVVWEANGAAVESALNRVLARASEGTT